MIKGLPGRAGRIRPLPPDSYTVRVDRIGDATGTVTEWSQTISRSGDYGHYQLGPNRTVTITGTGYGEYRTTCQANDSVYESFEVLHDATRTSPLRVRNHARALLSIPEPQPAGAPSLTEHYNYVNLPAWGFWVCPMLCVNGVVLVIGCV